MILNDLNGGVPVGAFIVRFKVRLGDVSTNGPAAGFSFSFGPQVNGSHSSARKELKARCA